MSKEVNVLKFNKGSVGEIGRSTLVSYHICEQESNPRKIMQMEEHTNQQTHLSQKPEFSCLNQVVCINVLG